MLRYEKNLQRLCGGNDDGETRRLRTQQETRIEAAGDFVIDQKKL